MTGEGVRGRAHPLDVLRWAGRVRRRAWWSRPASATPRSSTSSAGRSPSADVVLLDTGYLFAETQWYADRLRERRRPPRAGPRGRRQAPSSTSGRPTPTACCGAQGRAARAGAGRQDGVGDRAAPGRLRRAGDHADRPRRPAARRDQDQPASPWSDAEVEHYAAIELLPAHPLTDRGYPRSAAGRAPAGREGDDLGPDAGPAAPRPSAAALRAAPGGPPMSVEDVKRASGFLRGELAERARRGADRFERRQHGAAQVPRHLPAGRPRRPARAGDRRSCRSTTRAWSARRCPAAQLTADQWQALDRLADLADGTMRLTTRQGVQFHVVHKGELRELVHGINAALLTTLAACGDVVRNVMGCAVARRAPGRARAPCSTTSSPASGRARRRTGSCGSTARRR